MASDPHQLSAPQVSLSNGQNTPQPQVLQVPQPFIVQLPAQPENKKTLWDKLDLASKLAGASFIPIAIFLATVVFNNQQNYLSNKQHDNDVHAASTQHANDVQSATDQQRQTALDTYIAQMSDLLVIDSKDKLQKSTSPNDEVRRVARARTVIVLSALDKDPMRKRFVLQFLFDTKLINSDSPSKTDHPFVKLDFANLDNAGLDGMNLENVDIHDLFMRDAHLHLGLPLK